MSREELVGAYVGGAVSRRVFIRGLVALGVSAGAAVAYADVLTSSAVAQTTTTADIYPDDTTTTTTAAPTTTADSGVAAGQVGRSGAATPVETDPSFTG
jgi:hypothetical protein